MTVLTNLKMTSNLKYLNLISLLLLYTFCNLCVYFIFFNSDTIIHIVMNERDQARIAPKLKREMPRNEYVPTPTWKIRKAFNRQFR